MSVVSEVSMVPTAPTVSEVSMVSEVPTVSKVFEVSVVSEVPTVSKLPTVSVVSEVAIGACRAVWVPGQDLATLHLMQEVPILVHDKMC